MPGDWIDGLTPKERVDWDNFVVRARAEAVHLIDESALVMSLVPDAGQVDIKFAVELGLAIMLDKPVVAVAFPGREVPPGLRRVAHAVIELTEDFDTAAGRQEMADKLGPIAKRLCEEGDSA